MWLLRRNVLDIIFIISGVVVEVRVIIFMIESYRYICFVREFDLFYVYVGF